MGTISTTVTIAVDLQHPEINTIHAKQFDSLSRYADIKLLSGGQPWAAESSITYVIQYAKPDGTKGMYDKLPDGTTDAVTAKTDASSGTVLRARFAPQMLTVAGRVRFSIAMVQTDGTKLQTFSANLEVEPSEVNSYTSEDYYKVTSLDELLEEVKKRVKSVNNILPNTKGDVYINAGSITAQVPSLAYLGNVEGALEALATMHAALPIARASSADGIAYTATGDDLPTVKAGSASARVGKGRQIVFIPSSKNKSDAPTLQLNGGEAIQIRLRAPKNQGSDDSAPDATLPVQVGALMAGVPYTMTFCGLYWLIDSQICGINQIFEVNITKNADGTYTSDKTFEALKAAHDGGRILICSFEDLTMRWNSAYLLQLSWATAESFGFSGVLSPEQGYKIMAEVWINSINNIGFTVTEINDFPRPTALDIGKVMAVSENGNAEWTAVINAEEVAV